MIVINKKILKIILFVILFILCIILIFTKVKFNKTMQTSAIKSQDKIIVLDAGHGSPDEGAVGYSGITEASINLKITLKVKNKLEEKGIKVILTRSEDRGIYDNNYSSIREMKKSDLKNRVNIANQSNANAFISIHLNKIEQSVYWGWQTFFQKSSEDSLKLANEVQNGISKIIDKKNKRVPLKIENIYIMDNITIPSIIVECGFLSNPEEEQMLNTDEYQEKLAEGISLGIINYLEY